MDEMVSIPIPPVGAPCNGCGVCCRMSVCTTGSKVMKLVQNLGDVAPGPCPALTLQDGKYQCGLLLFPKKWMKSTHNADVLRKAISIRISAGTGCDSDGENPTPERKAALDSYIELRKYELEHSDELYSAILWSSKILFNK